MIRSSINPDLCITEGLNDFFVDVQENYDRDQILQFITWMLQTSTKNKSYTLMKKCR